MKNIFKAILLILTGFYSYRSYSQNLVPNPSFEQYSICPNAADEAYKATGWNAFRESPDYFNSCASIFATVPNNQQGYQFPSLGNGYCGFWTYAFNSFYREIIGSQLSIPLTIGQKYFVSFEVVLSDNSGYGGCAINKIGAKFSTIPFSFANPSPISNTAQVYSSSIVNDTINWTKISGSFIADSSYNYIMLGNFFDDSHTDTTQMYGAFNCFSYYFIENVCVSIDSLYTTTWTSVQDVEGHEQKIKIFPNPTSRITHISYTGNDIPVISVYNSLGKQIPAQLTVFQNDIELNFNELKAGIYYLHILLNEKFFSEKIILLK